jgi:hypothetical protein
MDEDQDEGEEKVEFTAEQWERWKADHTTMIKNYYPKGEDDMHDPGMHCPCEPFVDEQMEMPFSFGDVSISFRIWRVFHYRLLPWKPKGQR